MAKDSTVGCIYMIRNHVTGDMYIGQTTQPLKARYRKHWRTAEHKECAGHLQNAMLKYGRDKFVIGVIEDSIIGIDNINAKESYCIKKYDTFNNGYNMTTGGEGFIRSEKYLDKFRGRNNSMYGKNHTTSAKKIMSEKAKIRRHSEETKKKISKILIGNKYSDPEIFRKLNKERRDSTPHSFIHAEYGKVTAPCWLLSKAFGLRNSAVHKVVSGDYKSTQGWKINE